MDITEEMLNELFTKQPVSQAAARNPKLELGNYTLCVENIKPVFEKGTNDDELKALVATLVITSSTTPIHAVASKTDIYFEMDNPIKWRREKNMRRLAGFVLALNGEPLNVAQFKQMYSPSQPFKGVLVGCQAYTSGRSGFVDYRWRHVPDQSVDDIKKRRN